MSWLAPLYLLGLGALAIPIALHMIRRIPRGRQPFSTLMFLRPSPPRMQRRRRLDQILLLLLRALAVTLIVAAFARPFFRRESALAAPAPGRLVAILLDTSASMQRPGAWDSARQSVLQTLDDLEPRDQVCLMAFDRQLRMLVPPPRESSGTSPASSAAAVRAELSRIEPGWQATDLALALVSATEQVLAAAAGRTVELVVVSDFQAGSDLDALADFTWPPGVELRTLAVSPNAAGNAWVRVMRFDEEIEVDRRVAVQVQNDPESTSEQFTLVWQYGDRPLADFTPLMVQVPPGQTRVLLVDRPEQADRIVLQDDPSEYDNTFYIGQITRRRADVLFLGPTAADDPESLLFFFQRGVADLLGLDCNVQVHSTRTDQTSGTGGTPAEGPVASRSTDNSASNAANGGPGDASAENQTDALAASGDSGEENRAEQGSGDEDRVEPDGQNSTQGEPASFDVETGELGTFDVVVVAEPIPVALQRRLIEYQEEGGTVLVVLPSDVDPRALDELLGPTLQYASSPLASDRSAGRMLESLDLQHPLLARFAEPKYADFTKIRFWHHWPVGLPDDDAWHVLARFDNGDPFLWEQRRGAGRLLAMSAGWHPHDGQLALSTKFVPLLAGIMELATQAFPTASSWAVGQRVTLEELGVPADAGGRLRWPSGEEKTFDQLGEAMLFERPGVYQLQWGEQTRRLAVNLTPQESLISPGALVQLEQDGVLMEDEAASAPQLRERKQQLQLEELEDDQRLWQWILAGALVMIAAESWMASRFARSTVQTTEEGVLA